MTPRMRRIMPHGLRAAVCAVSVLVGARGASAQVAQGSQVAQGPGPMTIERVENGFVIAPEMRFSTLDDHAARLAGVYGGWMIDNTFLIGGAGYWMTNRAGGDDIGYGGVVLQYAHRADRQAGIGGRGLLGFGRATLSDDVMTLNPLPLQPARRSSFAPLPYPGPYRIRYSVDFLVFEPQVNGFVNLGRNVRLTGGIGYRLIGDAHRVEDRLRGAVGSIGVEIGSFGRGR